MLVMIKLCRDFVLNCILLNRSNLHFNTPWGSACHQGNYRCAELRGNPRPQSHCQVRAWAEMYVVERILTFFFLKLNNIVSSISVLFFAN